ncbi:sporulation membrane protein YtaF [[Clostridium] fimetarium]|uniref:Putative sporulation protein YtaF n=1 Tax=[Clostridium] fimetarium TaxID=99656 RepID=A0A1I0N580_9FIRM|nr:sporulation membrane protein YtaF [[Clostridium] fimetarium]SEV96171.1 putative sporulation protein YtaF [[Clostridium] fimetarium]
MNHILFTIFEAVLIAIALSTDAFIASFAYGSNKIKIPFSSMQVISLICTGILGISLLLGTFLKPYLPGDLLKIGAFSILFILGIIKLMDNIINSIIHKHAIIDKQIKFSFLNINFILNIYADPKEADLDESKTLSPKEALSLAVALSLDSLAAGFGVALGNVNIFAIILCSLIFSMLSIKSGAFIGNKISEKVPFQLSWLSGFLLIFLAFLRL